MFKVAMHPDKHKKAVKASPKESFAQFLHPYFFKIAQIPYFWYGDKNDRRNYNYNIFYTLICTVSCFGGLDLPNAEKLR